MQGQLNQKSKVREWRHMLLFFTSGLLLFETLTGLSIYLLPFSIPNQVMVLLHTGIGLIFLIPFGWYQIRHWLIYRTWSMTHIKLTGYFTLAATTVAIVSGLVLTYQVIWGTRISYGWDLAHIIATFTLVAAVVPHIGVLLYRDFKARHQEALQPILRAQKEYGLRTVVLLGGFFAVVALLSFAYEPVKYVNEFPDDYSYLYGPDRPFAPSLATTESGGKVLQESNKLTL
ncbi:MAG: hypothetical protein IIB42_05185 [Candidatus Marinimicrobia bacterium]|nr:hypothetical protein [Candidatus Neomarinimicrobiota bacterium]